LAREHGFVQNEGLAYELAARFYSSRGFETIAHTYLRSARNCYDRWGAPRKVKQLDELYPHLHKELDPTSPTATMGAPAGLLDVETVIKASQALSSEMLLNKLIEKLMRIAVEDAGAERGLLILVRGHEPQIEAEATTAQGSVAVTVRQGIITPFDLPKSALQYVIRTRERVLLDDASIKNLYSEDEYLRQKRPRSVLCLPIVKQTKLVGALYLENNLTPCAFTSDRVAVFGGTGFASRDFAGECQPLFRSATQRSFPGARAEHKPHGQLRLGCSKCRNILVGGNLQHL
jgi:GAF domain-containing protein